MTPHTSPTVTPTSDPLTECLTKMHAEGLPRNVIANFERMWREVARGNRGTIAESEIYPPEHVISYEALANDPHVTERGRQALDSLVVIRLNGGLGTSMGLNRAKSLLEVKNGLTFNDIIARQIAYLNRSYSATIPLVNMTSFSTDDDVVGAMAAYRPNGDCEIPLTFLQHKHPKILADTLAPAAEKNDALNWNPPGHGDIYAALLATPRGGGMSLAHRLLALGKRYLFVANVDNLGATVSLPLLGHLVMTGSAFMMETAERTAADSKGGHLACRRSDGRFLLRETAQAPLTPSGEIIPEFSDIRRYRYFNTNNLWLDLVQVVELASRHGGLLPLPLIANRKSVDPRDPSSKKVIQLESAMGAGTELFDNALPVCVPRTRFFPVKSNSDLMVLRSSAVSIEENGDLIISRQRKRPGLPLVRLDSKAYGSISDFEALVRHVPCLLDADELKVEGKVLFDRHVKIEGSVAITASSAQPTPLPAAVDVLTDCIVPL